MQASAHWEPARSRAGIITRRRSSRGRPSDLLLVLGIERKARAAR